jgi:hypothetical protein
LKPGLDHLASFIEEVIHAPPAFNLAARAFQSLDNYSQRHQFIILFIDAGTFIQVPFDIRELIPGFLSKVDRSKRLPPSSGSRSCTGSFLYF